MQPNIFDIVMEEALSTESRNHLDDADFGIPQLRKYPLIDAEHVRSAISYFDKAPTKYKPILATNIRKAAKKYGIEIATSSDVHKF